MVRTADKDKTIAALKARIKELEAELRTTRYAEFRLEIGRDGQIREADETFADLVGRSPKALKGARLEKFLSFYREHLDVVLDHFIKGKRFSGPAKDYETYGLKGTDRYFRFSFGPKRDRRGVIRGFRITAKEVTGEYLQMRLRWRDRGATAINGAIECLHLGLLRAFNIWGKAFTSSTLIGGISTRMARSLRYKIKKTPPEIFDLQPELYWKPVTHFLTPETVRGLNRLHASGKEDWIEGEVLAQDGSRRSVRLAIQDYIGLWGNLSFNILIVDRSEDEKVQRRLNEQLVESEEKFRNLFENAGDPIFLEDLDGNILDANKRACELYGYSPKEMRALKVGGLLTKEAAAKLSDFRKMIERKGLAFIETQNKARDGSLIDVEVSASAVEIGGRMLALVICRDIRERKRLERERRESEEKYRNLFENAIDPVFLSEFNGTVLDCNKAATDLYGCDRATLLAMNAWELVPQEERPKIRDFGKALEREGKAHVETKVKLPNGSLIELDTRATVIELGGRRLLNVISRNITERNRLARERQESEEKYRNIFQNAHDPVLVTDAETGRVLDCNRRACNLYGYTREEFLRLRTKDLTADEYVNRMPEFKTQIIAAGHALFEGRGKTRDGTVLNVEVRVSALESAGRLIFYVIIHDMTERKRLERERQESEEKYRRIFENAHDAIFITDSETRKIVDCNSRACELYGYTHEEFLKLDTKAITPDEDIERVAEYRKKILAEGYAVFEAHGKTRDGTILDVEASASILRTAARTYLYVIIRDTTERKRLEREIRDSEQRYRTLFENASEAIFLMTPEYDILDCNRRACELYGYRREELLKMKAEDIAADDARERFALFHEQIWSAKHAVFETGGRRSDGLRLDVEVSVSLMDLDGRIVELVICRDITERKRFEQQIQQSEEKYRALVENLNAGLIIIQDERIQFANRPMAEVTGYPPETLQGKPFHEFIVPEDRNLARERYFARQAGQQLAPANVLRIQHADGREISIEVYASLVRYEGRAATQVILRDVTEQKQLQAQLQRAERLASVGTLAAGVAHEINNPVAVISVDALRMKRQYENDPFIVDMCSKLMRMTKRIFEITSGLLTFSKATGGVFGKHPLGAALNVALDLVRSRFEFEHKQLIQNYPAKLPMIWCDSDQLQQVFVNLCINALEAMPKNGTLKVSAKRSQKKNQVTIKFADTGKGMTAKEIERAFDPFYTTKDTGSGLGLAICHSIIEDHGGQISIQSTPGKGTAVSVVLPIHKPRGSSPRPK